MTQETRRPRLPRNPLLVPVTVPHGRGTFLWRLRVPRTAHAVEIVGNAQKLAKARLTLAGAIVRPTRDVTLFTTRSQHDSLPGHC